MPWASSSGTGDCLMLILNVPYVSALRLHSGVIWGRVILPVSSLLKTVATQRFVRFESWPELPLKELLWSASTTRLSGRTGMGPLSPVLLASRMAKFLRVEIVSGRHWLS